MVLCDPGSQSPARFRRVPTFRARWFYPCRQRLEILTCAYRPCACCGLSADEGFVNLYSAAQLAAVLPLLARSALEHEPSGFLSDAMARAISQELMPFLQFRIIHIAGKPFFKPDRGVFKNGPDFHENLAWLCLP